MKLSRNNKIALRVGLYSFLVGTTILFVIINRSPSLNSQLRLKNRLCKIDMANFTAAAREFVDEYNSLPAGKGPAILKALMGQNATQITFLQISPLSLDEEGSFVDPWRTPYQIETNQTNGLTIRSAGRNRRFGDSDDLEQSLIVDSPGQVPR